MAFFAFLFMPLADILVQRSNAPVSEKWLTTLLSELIQLYIYGSLIAAVRPHEQSHESSGQDSGVELSNQDRGRAHS
jgi:hypothetical protein